MTQKNEQGFTLVEVLIAAAIMMITMLAFGAMMDFQRRQVKNLEQKLEILDYKTLLQQLFSTASNCACQFTPADTFDSTASSPSITLAQIKSDCASQFLLQAGQRLPSGLTVSSIQLAGLTLVAGNQWKGNWVVTFGNFQGMALRPLSINQIVAADTTTPTAATITGCTATSSTPRPSIKNFTITAVAVDTTADLGNRSMCVWTGIASTFTQGGNQRIWPQGPQNPDGTYHWFAANPNGGKDYDQFLDVGCFDF